MHTTIKLTDQTAGHKVSFLEVYQWLQSNVGPKLAWRSVQVAGQGWTIETTSMLQNSLVVNIDDPSHAMMFRLRFGGEIMPPEDIDSEWKNS
jgi:hypothetical protein